MCFNSLPFQTCVHNLHYVLPVISHQYCLQMADRLKTTCTKPPRIFHAHIVILWWVLIVRCCLRLLSTSSFENRAGVTKSPRSSILRAFAIGARRVDFIDVYSTKVIGEKIMYVLNQSGGYTRKSHLRWWSCRRYIEINILMHGSIHRWGPLLQRTVLFPQDVRL